MLKKKTNPPKQKEKSIISAATDKITENNIELEALEKKYANKIKNDKIHTRKLTAHME